MNRPSRPTKVRYRPPPETVVSTPGSPIPTCLAGESTLCPRKNAANDSAVQQAHTTAANTSAFIASTWARCGVATNMPRIRPLLYSPVTVITPSAPTNSCASSIPCRTVKTGSNAAWLAGDAAALLRLPAPSILDQALAPTGQVMHDTMTRSAGRYVRSGMAAGR